MFLPGLLLKTINFTYLKCLIHCFKNIFTELCNYHQNLILEYFHQLHRKTCGHEQSFPIPNL